MPKYYPVMLDLRGRLAIVIGGDHMAAEKAAALVASGAYVRIISPAFCAELLEQAENGYITLRQKTYEPGDLAGAFIVVAATNDPQLIQAIWAETQQRGQPVNIVDVPEYCSFIMPSVLRRDQLTIAVSTEGASPGLAKRIRHRLEEIFPPAYGPYLRLAAAARAQLRAAGVSYQQRDEFFGEFFASDVLIQLIAENTTQAAATTAILLACYGIEIEASVLEASLDNEKTYINT